MGSTTSTSTLETSPDRVAGRSAWLVRHWLVVVAFAILFAGALAVRLATFERYLPYLDYQDESHLYVYSRAWSGVEPNGFMLQRLAGYPPLYVVIHNVVQRIYERLSPQPWYLPSDYIYVLRLVAVAAGVITTILTADIGWQLGGPVAAWFAGAVWAFSPLVIDNNSLAIADPLVYMTSAGAVAFALRAWRRESLRWLFASLVMGILAIYAKYWTLYTLVPWMLAGAKILRSRGRQALAGIGLQVLTGMAAAGLLLAYLSASGLSRLSPEMTSFSDAGLSNILNLPRQLNNWSYGPLPIGTQVFWLTLLGAVPAFAYSAPHRWRRVDLKLVLVLFATVLLAVIFTSSFIYISSVKYIRHALPLSTMLAGIWGAALAQIVWTLADIGANLPALRWIGRLKGVAILVLGLSIGLASVIGVQSLRQHFALQPTQQLLWQWADANLPLDGRVLMLRNGPLNDTWNRPWSGYDGSKPFDWWFIQNDDALGTPSEYVERGIMYFVDTPDERMTWFDTPEKQAFLDQLVPLKTIAAAPDRLGPAIEIYRLKPPEVAVSDVVFGDQIALVGYDLNNSALAPGDTVRFRPYWRAMKPPVTNYSMFVHLYPVGERSQIIAQHDGAPSTPERLTLTWTEVDELHIGADVSLAIPVDAAPGNYEVAIGLYDFTTGQRLSTGGSSDAFIIPVQVTP